MEKDLNMCYPMLLILQKVLGFSGSVSALASFVMVFAVPQFCMAQRVLNKIAGDHPNRLQEHSEQVATPPVKDGLPTIRFTEHLIMKDYVYPFGIWSGDLDGDGDVDLTSTDACFPGDMHDYPTGSGVHHPYHLAPGREDCCDQHNNIYWFENDGSGGFTRRFIQRNEPDPPSMRGHDFERHTVGDINGDGYPDVVTVMNKHGELLWFENSGNPKSGKLWKRHLITTAPDHAGKLPYAYDVTLADLDSDGDLDVAASSWRGNEFTWFENQGTQWKKRVITSTDETRTMRAVDFDRDGDTDLLGTVRDRDGLVLWFENSGKPASHPWKPHVIDHAPWPVHGHPVDMDGDGDQDVVMVLGYAAEERESQVVWYENVGGNSKIIWNKHIIREPFPDALEAAAADMDGDGNIEVVASAYDVGRIAWFEHDGDPRGTWTMHILKDNWRRCSQVILVDLDGDRDLDVASVADRPSREFRWWRNDGRLEE